METRLTAPQGLTSLELEALDAALTSRALAPNEVLLRAGDFNDTLYFVQHGELIISLPFTTGPLFVGTRAAGAWVGELTFLAPGQATATVVAAEQTTVRALSASSLTTLMASHPALVSKLVRSLSEDLAARMRSAGVVLEDGVKNAQQAPGFFRSVFSRLFGGAAS